MRSEGQEGGVACACALPHGGLAGGLRLAPWGPGRWPPDLVGSGLPVGRPGRLRLACGAAWPAGGRGRGGTVGAGSGRQRRESPIGIWRQAGASETRGERGTWMGDAETEPQRAMHEGD
nr:unnamed protein product [Digitaria exilis]